MDGDGRRELLITSGTTLHRITIPRDGSPVVREHRMPHSGFCFALSAGDLDRNGCDELLMLFGGASAQPPRLAAYSLEGDELVPYGERPHNFNGGVEQQSIVVADVDNDHLPDVVIGLASGSSGERMREVRVIAHPFMNAAVDEALPLQCCTRSDVLSVFVANLDGVPGLEVGCTTGPWRRGFDLRIWRRTDGRFGEPVAVGPYGTMRWAFPVVARGDGLAEILLLKSSESLPNVECLPAPPHRGIEEGLYVLATQKKMWEEPEVGPGGARQQQAIPLSEPHPLGVRIRSEGELIRATAASTHEGAEGTLCAVAWHVSAGESLGSFLDLHVRDAESARLTRHRILWQEGTRGLSCSLIDAASRIDGTTRTALAVLREDAAVAGRWAAELWRLEPLPSPSITRLIAPRLIEAHNRLGFPERALALAEKRLWPDAAFEGPCGLELAVRLAQSASRAFRQASLAAAIERCRAEMPLASEELRARFELEIRRLSDIERGFRRLLSDSAAYEARDRSVYLAADGPSPSPPRLEIVHLESVRVDTDSDLLLSLDLEVVSLAYARSMFVGLVKEDSQWPESGYGIWLYCRGRTDNPERRADLKWEERTLESGAFDERKNLKESHRYEFRLWRTSDARAHLARADCAEPEVWFHEEIPRYDSSKNPESDIPSPAVLARPLAPGNYVLGVFVSPKGPIPLVTEDTRLQIRHVELRHAPSSH